MSNYYDYREVKVMTARALMAKEGWKVYDYKEDTSDSMTDYYNPANWGGIATKNGYVFCVNVYGAAEPREIRRYKHSVTLSKDTMDKIKKLEAVTVERGATIHEEQTAKEKIALLKGKQEDAKNDYEVTEVIPGHQEHPSRCNWHIEKEGVIVAKGNGILKYSQAYDYFNYDSHKESIDSFKKDAKKWADKWVLDVMNRDYYDSEEEARKACERHIKDK